MKSYYIKTHHTQKDGTVIPIAEMTDKHLLCTIALFEKRCAEGVIVRSGGGSCAEDMWYDEDRLTGKKAEAHVGLAAYRLEAQKRNL